MVEVQAVAVGHGCGVGDADWLGVTSLGWGDGLGDAVSDGDGDRDGDGAAIDGRPVREPSAWIDRAMVPAATMRAKAGIAQRYGR
jgi:hypothetical protein